MNGLVNFVSANPGTALGALLGVIVLLLVLVVYLFASLSSLKGL